MTKTKKIISFIAFVMGWTTIHIVASPYLLLVTLLDWLSQDHYSKTIMEFYHKLFTQNKQEDI